MPYIDVWGEPCLSFNAKGVFCLLRRFADNETLRCWPSIGKLTELSGLSRPTLKKALHELETAHLLQIQPHVSPRGVICTNYYQLMYPLGSSGLAPGGKELAVEGKGIAVEGKPLAPEGKNLTAGGKQLAPNLSKRTYVENLSTERESRNSPRYRVPKAFASLGVDPREFGQS